MQQVGPPLQRTTLKAQVSERIRSLIRRGELKSGEVVTEVGLASLLGVSRTPVREAIVELTNERLFDSLATGGVRVHQLSDLEQQEIFLLRTTLEVLAVTRLASSITPEQLSSLEFILLEQERAERDREQFLNVDQQFHLMLADFAGLALTERILGTLRDMLYLMGLAAVTTKGRGPSVLAEHHAILHAIATAQPDEAARAISHHLSETQRSIRSLRQS